MDRVLFDVRRVGVCYANHVAKLLRRWNFTHSRVDVFVIHARVIAHHGVVYQSDIRARLGIARRTMSIMMRRLELRGLIERRRSEEDRRKIVVGITELGRRAFAELRSFIGAEWLTPDVNMNLPFNDPPISVSALPQKRSRFLGYLAALRTQFRDLSTAPYPL